VSVLEIDRTIDLFHKNNYDYPFSTPAENAVNKKISANHFKFCQIDVFCGVSAG